MTQNRSILLLGSRSDFSAVVLTHLARAGFGPMRAAVLRSSSPGGPGLDTGARTLPVNVADPLSRAAEASGTPLEVLDDIGELSRQGRDFDLIVTACFPRRVPASVLARARMSSLNVHPSLLPAYRGPSPLFWQLRAGESTVGVSIHRLSNELDAGDVVAAEALALAPQMSAKEIHRAVVQAGAALLTRTLQHEDWCALPGSAQDPEKASYYSWPVAEDFSISRRWPAERAFRFMRGTQNWGHPYAVHVDGVRLLLDRALSYDARGRLPDAWSQRGHSVSIGFQPGVLRAVLRQMPVKPDGKARPPAGRA